MQNLLGEDEKRNWRALEAQYVQKPFAKAIRQCIDSGLIYRLNPNLIFVEFTSTANTFAGSARAGKLQKDMGYRAGWLDLTFIWRFKEKLYPEFGLMECKFADNTYSDNQKFMATRMTEAGINHGIIYKPQEGFDLLKAWGFKLL